MQPACPMRVEGRERAEQGRRQLILLIIGGGGGGVGRRGKTRANTKRLRLTTTIMMKTTTTKTTTTMMDKFSVAITMTISFFFPPLFGLILAEVFHLRFFFSFFFPPIGWPSRMSRHLSGPLFALCSLLFRASKMCGLHFVFLLSWWRWWRRWWRRRRR